MQPYLYENENPNAPRRDNGLRFWGYPQRKQLARVIALHTAEISPSPGSAWNIAKYFTHSTRPASYHQIVDSDNDIPLLPDEAVAFHVRGFNSPSLGLSWATRAADWGKHSEWDDRALWRGARVAAKWSRVHDIPVRLISAYQANNGVSGFVTHAQMDPGRRSDPGIRFPMELFFRRVNDVLDNPEEDDDDMGTIVKERHTQNLWFFGGRVFRCRNTDAVRQLDSAGLVKNSNDLVDETYPLLSRFVLDDARYDPPQV